MDLFFFLSVSALSVVLHNNSVQVSCDAWFAYETHPFEQCFVSFSSWIFALITGVYQWRFSLYLGLPITLQTVRKLPCEAMSEATPKPDCSGNGNLH